MSDFKHTAGEWTVVDNFDIEKQRYVPAYSVKAGNKCISNFNLNSREYCSSQQHYEAQKQEAEANARLTAAAPDMLELLEMFEGRMLAGLPIGKFEQELLERVINKAKL